MLRQLTRNELSEGTANLDRPLFATILVPLAGPDQSWAAFDQALQLARREGSRLEGLYVVPSLAQVSGYTPHTMRSRFDRLCQEAEVSGGLLIEVGDVCRKICEEAHWADLVVLDSSHCLRDQPFARLNPKFTTLLRTCPKPVLAVPESASPEWRRALLVYDGSPKANRALTLTRYLITSNRWQLSLTMVTLLEGRRVTVEQVNQARAYLESGGAAVNLVVTQGPVAETILSVATERHSDVVIIGGYSLGSMLEMVLGNPVDQLLRRLSIPVLIWR
jgi:nucleotide-binding universal stress UspA family protein